MLYLHLTECRGTTSSNNLYTKLESVEAVDDMTVKIVLINPNLDWPYMMTIPTTSILSEKQLPMIRQKE